MEELQISLENAMYQSAIHETLRPVSSWVWPSKAEMERYLSDHRGTNSTAWDIAKVCENPLGFHLFLKYVDNRGLEVLADFIRACAVYRNLTHGMRLQSGIEIAVTYLLCKYPVKVSSKWPSTLARKLHHEISLDATSYFDAMESANCVCVRGAPYEQALHSIERAMSRMEMGSLLSSQISVASEHSQVSNVSEDIRIPPHRSNRVSDIRSVIAESTAINRLRANNGGNVQQRSALWGGIRVRNDDNNANVEEKDTTGNNRDENMGLDEYTVSLSADLFDVLDHIVFSELKSRCEDGFKASPYWQDYINFSIISERKVTVDDFSYVRPIGRGGFGYVHACFRKNSGKVFAIKEMNKGRIALRKASNLMKNERDILIRIDSPFILKLRYSFSDAENLYIVTDLMTGGDLGFQLKKRTRFSVQMAKYYAARTLLGVQALHSAGIMYRDLKPDNILLNAKGETKLVDMGLATEIDPGGMVQICGTRGYWAPEIIRRSSGNRNLRYSESADWFSLGCCIYEFLAGVSPFNTVEALKWQSSDAMFSCLSPVDQAILEMTPLFDPSYFEPVVIDLIEKLLCKDGNMRLGANGAEEIKVHAWFADINWNHMEAGIVVPPCEPGCDMNIHAQSDIGVFDENFDRRAIPQGGDDAFVNWDYTSKSAFFSEVVESYSQLYKDSLGVRAPVSTRSDAQCCTIS